MTNDIFLVTGAAGFVGGELVKLLSSQGIKIRALIKDPKQAKQLKPYVKEIVVGNLKDVDSLNRAVSGVKGIFHIAAIFRQAGIPDQEYFEVNANGTRNLFEAAIKAGVKRIIHCSTVGVLSDVGENEIADESVSYNPGDLYQSSKVEGEKIALAYYQSGKIEGLVLRPAMVYGPGDMRTLKLFSLIAKRRFFYVGSGNCYVHFIDVRDLARAFQLAMQSLISNKVYIICGRHALKLRDFVNLVAARLGVSKPWIRVPVKPMQLAGLLCELICKPFGIEPPLYRRRVDFFTKNRRFNGLAAEQYLGFSASNTLTQEIDDIINWYRQNKYLPTDKAKLSSKIIRAISGKIYDWDYQAQRIYGWSQQEVIGKTTHSLLETKFPYDLEAINHQLLKNNFWSGNLVHTKRDGSKVAVMSTWELANKQTDQPIVYEFNYEQHTQSNFNNFINCYVPSLSSLTEHFHDVLCYV